MLESSIKVSIVVPVYNVEKYLVKCLESLVNQTYKNIEILLVDDGSTDSSGAICDEYARKYSNIQVFHKENGGLSSARNFALPYLTGQYVAFVDSDDYVELNYIECLLSPVLNNQSGNTVDIVICKFIVENLDYAVKLVKNLKCIDNSFLTEHMTSQTALESLCYRDKFGTSVCGKIFTSKQAQQFPFPDGHLYEDLATFFKILGTASNIVFIDVPLYHYVQRSNSITHSPWTPRVWDLVEAAQTLLDYIDSHYPAIHKAGVARLFSSMSEFYVRAFQENSYVEIIKPVQYKLRVLWPDIANNPKLPVWRKLQYWMMIRTPRLYRRFYSHLKLLKSWLSL